MGRRTRMPVIVRHWNNTGIGVPLPMPPQGIIFGHLEFEDRVVDGGAEADYFVEAFEVFGGDDGDDLVVAGSEGSGFVEDEGVDFGGGFEDCAVLDEQAEAGGAAHGGDDGGGSGEH